MNKLTYEEVDKIVADANNGDGTYDVEKLDLLLANGIEYELKQYGIMWRHNSEYWKLQTNFKKEEI